MEKKLYCVRVLMYVMAENASEACVAATQAPFDIFEVHARKADRVHAEWEDAIPYNANDERTCREILADEKAMRSATPIALPEPRFRTNLRIGLSSTVRASAR